MLYKENFCSLNLYFHWERLLIQHQTLSVGDETINT